MPEKEAKARIKINQMLAESGWRLLDGPAGKANVRLETSIKHADFGDDFEKLPSGVADYVLYESHNFPIAVLEAKSESKHPLDGKEQARA